jgi:3-deoxy-D-manno-octulosonate 8-phosphate phosphatase (KDO 8-P phosphatase)
VQKTPDALVPKVPQEEKDLDTLLGEIELVVLEAEGVLTDGTTVCSQDGSESIKTHKADSLGLANWIELGGKAVVVAREELKAVEAWCQARGITHRVHQGPKAPMMQMIIFENQMEPRQVMYIGADLDDLPAMIIAGLAAAPSDAHNWAREGAHVQLTRPGGRGAVRELLDLLAEKRSPLET